LPNDGLKNVTKAPPEIVIQHHGKTLFGLMEEWQQRLQLPSVLLLTGQSGIGKRSMVYFLAQWILCERQGFYSSTSISDDHPSDKQTLEPRPCGHCPSCQRVLSGNDIHFTEVFADSDEESAAGSSSAASNSGNSGALKIEQFRKLKASMGFSAPEGRSKIILIPAADRMTLQAANSVLKLLEETPPGWIFFLTANDPTLLLPTVASRCQIFRLKPFSADEIEELLRQSGVDSQRIKICATLAQGSWDRALSLAKDETWEQRRALFQFLKAPSSNIHTLVDWASMQPSHFDTLIDLLEQLTADLIRWTASSSISQPESYSWIQSDGVEALSFHAREFVRKHRGIDRAKAAWIRHAEGLAQARMKSSLPLNKKLLIQDVLLPWMEGKR
jgi:DNA polymerase-3 subunit delta'